MRLIDADRLSEAIYDNVPAPYEDASWAKENCLAEIEAAQTVDAVEVVRCRECVHYEMGVCLKIYDNGAASRYAWQERKPDDFCSYGERKRGADNG